MPAQDPTGYGKGNSKSPQDFPSGKSSKSPQDFPSGGSGSSPQDFSTGGGPGPMPETPPPGKGPRSSPQG
jgi:hypothetical protein